MELSLAEARRLALVAQGFGRRPAKRTLGDVRKLTAKVPSITLDSVNVLVRSHYLPAYSRLGPYPMDAIDTLAYEYQELYETWGHATCLMPVGLWPLFKYRTTAIRELNWIGWPEGQARSDVPRVAALYDELVDRGPLAASELSTAERRKSTWWGWGESKGLLETLLDCGLVAAAGRRGFTRLYDIAERVIPGEVLDAPSPGAEESQKELLCLSARALGVGTAKQVAGYFGLYSHNHRTHVRGPDGKWPRRIWPRLLAELVAEGRLLEVAVEGWPSPGYVLPRTRVPGAVSLRALLSPFDTFARWSAESLCGFTNPLSQQLYVPAERRQYGYYVLPFLLGDTLVGRCDLKADRDRGVLMVQSAYVEPGQDDGYVASELADELHSLRSWLELDSIAVASRGNLATLLRRSLES